MDETHERNNFGKELTSTHSREYITGDIDLDCLELQMRHVCFISSLRTDPNWKNGQNNVSLKHREDKSGWVRIQFRIPRETGSDVVGFVS